MAIGYEQLLKEHFVIIVAKSFIKFAGSVYCDTNVHSYIAENDSKKATLSQQNALQFMQSSPGLLCV